MNFAEGTPARARFAGEREHPAGWIHRAPGLAEGTRPHSGWRAQPPHAGAGRADGDVGQRGPRHGGVDGVGGESLNTGTF